MSSSRDNRLDHAFADTDQGVTVKPKNGVYEQEEWREYWSELREVVLSQPDSVLRVRHQHPCYPTWRDAVRLRMRSLNWEVDDFGPNHVQCVRKGMFDSLRDDWQAKEVDSLGWDQQTRHSQQQQQHAVTSARNTRTHGLGASGKRGHGMHAGEDGGEVEDDEGRLESNAPHSAHFTSLLDQPVNPESETYAMAENAARGNWRRYGRFYFQNQEAYTHFVLLRSVIRNSTRERPFVETASSSSSSSSSGNVDDMTAHELDVELRTMPHLCTQLGLFDWILTRSSNQARALASKLAAFYKANGFPLPRWFDCTPAEALKCVITIPHIVDMIRDHYSERELELFGSRLAYGRYLEFLDVAVDGGARKMMQQLVNECHEVGLAQYVATKTQRLPLLGVMMRYYASRRYPLPEWGSWDVVQKALRGETTTPKQEDEQNDAQPEGDTGDTTNNDTQGKHHTPERAKQEPQTHTGNVKQEQDVEQKRMKKEDSVVVERVADDGTAIVVSDSEDDEEVQLVTSNGTPIKTRPRTSTRTRGGKDTRKRENYIEVELNSDDDDDDDDDGEQPDRKRARVRHGR